MSSKELEATMKLTRGEKRLLVVLLLILIMAAYYYFVFLVQEKTLEALQDEKTDLNERWEQTSEQLKVGKVDKHHLESVQTLIDENAAYFYGSLSQSEFLMIINEIAKKTGVEIVDIELDYNTQSVQEYILNNYLQDESATEATNAEMSASGQPMGEIHRQRAEINCRASYQTLSDFINEINSSTKKLNIAELKLTAGEGELLDCRLAVGVNHMPALDKYIDKNDGANRFALAAQQRKQEAMFNPYQDYDERIKRAQTDRAARFEDPTVALNQPAETPDLETVEAPTEPAEAARLLFDFRNLDYFFAGNKPEINGTLTLQDNALSDHKIAFLNYRFHDLNGVNQANVVFPEQVVMCRDYSRKLRLKLYSEQAQRNAVKVEIIDAAANRYSASFDSVANAADWQYAYADLPSDLHYPIMIKRIYVEGDGVQQDLSGELYLDSLAAIEAEGQGEIEETLEWKS